MNYDLEKRTLAFSKDIINLLKAIKPNYLNRNIISQLIRSSTSVGANYREANGASSKKISGMKYIFAEKKYKKQNIG